MYGPMASPSLLQAARMLYDTPVSMRVSDVTTVVAATPGVVSATIAMPCSRENDVRVYIVATESPSTDHAVTTQTGTDNASVSKGGQVMFFSPLLL